MADVTGEHLSDLKHIGEASASFQTHQFPAMFDGVLTRNPSVGVAEVQTSDVKRFRMHRGRAG